MAIERPSDFIQSSAKLRTPASRTVEMFCGRGFEYFFFLNLKGGESPLYDGGDHPFSTSTLATIGQAVVEILRHLEETKNRAVFVQDLVITQ